MITKNIDSAIEHLIEDTFHAGALPDAPVLEIVADKKKELLAFMRAEAINLADSIIGKDRVLHSHLDSHGSEYFDPADKAVFDYQVAQRVVLADYQSGKKKFDGPTGPMVDDNLAPNEQ